MSLKQHPLSQLFPPMPADEFRELVEDIKRQGVLEPIELLDGMVLDGWNRYSACQELGIACPSNTYSREDRSTDEAFQYVWARNVLRRHLSAAQRIQIVAKRHPEDWEKVGAQRHQLSGRHRDGNLSSAAKQLADMAGVHEDSVRMAKQLADDKKNSDLWERATAGELSLTAANAQRLGRQIDKAKQDGKTHQQKKEMEWNTHFVKEVIERVDAISKTLGPDIHAGLKHGKFAPEAKAFVARRLEWAITALMQAQEELRK